MKFFWIIIGVIVIVIIGGYGGYRFYHHATNQIGSTQTKIPHQTMMTEPTIITSNSVYKVMPSGKLGPIFTDTKGITLYTYKKDTNGKSNCMNGCLKAWPAYIAPSQTGGFPANISAIKRSDGTLQYSWKGMPLYYYSNDKHAGDVNGEGIGGVWYVVK